MTSKVVYKTSNIFHAKRKTFTEKILKVSNFVIFNLSATFIWNFYQNKIIKNLT